MTWQVFRSSETCHSSIATTANTICNYWYPAYDESGESFFDYNYYSDYTGTDEDNNGIGDTPYISLHGNIMDDHPLMFLPSSESKIFPPTEFPFQLIAVLGIGIVMGVFHQQVMQTSMADG